VSARLGSEEGLARGGEEVEPGAAGEGLELEPLAGQGAVEEQARPGGRPPESRFEELQGGDQVGGLIAPAGAIDQGGRKVVRPRRIGGRGAVGGPESLRGPLQAVGVAGQEEAREALLAGTAPAVEHLSEAPRELRAGRRAAGPGHAIRGHRDEAVRHPARTRPEQCLDRPAPRRLPGESRPGPGERRGLGRGKEGAQSGDEDDRENRSERSPPRAILPRFPFGSVPLHGPLFGWTDREVSPLGAPRSAARRAVGRTQYSRPPTGASDRPGQIAAWSSTDCDGCCECIIPCARACRLVVG